MRIINPQKIQKADLVVGIPSYNEAENIGFVVEQVCLGLKKYFPEKISVVINVDNNSTDGTQEAFLKAQGEIPKIYISTEKNKKGKGYNLHNLFLMLKKLQAKVGLVLDADLKSIQPIWIKKMATPIFNGYHYTAPYYFRFKNDATITNHLAYPLMYGLLGWDIRQPIGGDFAFSDQMVDIWLKQKWSKTTYKFGVDIFMSLNAFFAEMKTCQVNLGTKIHRLSNPRLGPMFVQVAETLFEVILKHRAKIKAKPEIKKELIFSGEKIPALPNNQIDSQLFKKAFLAHFNFNPDLLKSIVSQSTAQKLAKIYQTKQGTIDLDLWTKIVYDFLYAYEKQKDSSLFEILRCFYFGRVASFFEQTNHLNLIETEKEIVKQAQYFFAKRDYFLKTLQQAQGKNK
jgi:glycosyltransferase involved in cell wall biosynthesis